MQQKDSRICKRNFCYRQIIFLSVLFLLCAELSAHSGMMWGEKKLRISKTKWFDIIYPACCQESAAILYEKADSLYEEVTAQYGISPSFRMPVVITPAVEQFNAFWTAAPYNHIAIYDTGSSGSGELAVFSESLLSTFRHELTHAVTYNMKNGFWRAMSAVFGDCVAPGMLSVTTGMAEGATVTSESAAGEGRLNDEYAKHYVKQAKIEDAFPSYHDVSGSSDVMPSGAPYYFNGAFHQWLQEQYGMEAYADFWYRVVNGRNLTISGAFKKAFGIKLKRAWSYFIDDYEVPDLAANPVKAGQVKDFFDPDSSDFSQMNNAGSVYESPSAAAGRLVWFDSFGGRVFAAEDFCQPDSGQPFASEEIPSYRHIFSQDGLTDLSLSNDGRFLALSYISANGPGAKARVKLYDFTSGSFYSVKTSGLKEATVLENEGQYYLLAQKYFAQHYSLAVYKIILKSDNSRIKELQPLSELVMEKETNPFALTPLDDGSFAYLKKKGLSYSLCIAAADASLLREYAFPQGMAVRSLSYNSGLFYFSYAQKGTLPRLGKMEAASGQLSLSGEDISGGIFEPVFWKGRLLYVGEFYRQSRLLILEEKVGAAGADVLADGAGELQPEADDLFDAEEKPGLEAGLNLAAVSSGESEKSFSIPSKAFNPFPYYFRGIFIPVTDYSSDYFGPNAAYVSNFNTFLIGGTWLTSNPWTNGASDLIKLTGGWNTLSNSFGASLTVTYGTETSLFGSQTQIKSEFDSKGWKQGGLISQLSTGFELGRISTISISNTATALLGRQDRQLNLDNAPEGIYASFNFWDKDKIGITAPQSDEKYFTLSDIISAQYSNIRRAGPGRFERAGFAFALSYGLRYDASLEKPEDAIQNVTALAAAARACIPHLLPFESKYGFTYNLPVTLNASLLPSSSIYGYAYLGENSQEEENAAERLGRVIFDASLEATFFSMEIQKAIPVITALYLNDFYVAGGYAATGTAGSASEGGFQTAKLGEYFEALGNGKGHYLDSIYLKGELEFTPNIGLFAKPSFKMGIYAIYSYSLNTVKKIKPEERAKLTFGLDMSF